MQTKPFIQENFFADINHNMSKPRESQGIRIPGVILDSIRDREDSGGYGDSRFSKPHRGRKGEKPQSRKDKRKQERELKKVKRRKVEKNPQKGNNKVKGGITGKKYNNNEKQGKKQKEFISNKGNDGSDEVNGDEEEDPIEALRKLKGNKKSSDIRIVKEDDLEEGDESGEMEDDFGDGFEDDLEDGFEDDLGDDLDDFDEDEDLEEEENPLEKLKAIKEAKKNNSSTTTTKESKKKDKKSKKEKDSNIKYATFRDPAMERDEEEMAFYAKKLGLKDGKNSKLTKTDDDDFIGGLLDGIDVDFSDKNVSEEDIDDIEEEEEEQQPDNHISQNDDEAFEKPWGSDDSISEGDFDSDLDEEDLAGLEDDEDNDGDNDDKYTVPKNENPFVAPSQGDSGSKYVPPALRRKMALESNEVSPETIALQKTIKGSLNKLTEGNISTIINSINELYLSSPRQLMNENLTDIVINSVVQQGRLLDTFVYLHSAVVAAIYRLQGVEFGAHFIQKVTESLEDYLSDDSKTKQASNLISLLSSVYAFQLTSSKLIYDIIKLLINKFNESSAEILLTLIKNSGNQIRSDDPAALKEIIILMNKVASELPEINPRTQFLIDTIASLRNNKMRATNDTAVELTIRLRKLLSSLNTNTDPIQVSLDDIRNVETRGKWWLVGSAWKGNNPQDITNEYHDTDAMNDILDEADPNWMELAKQQRMNTDIRRAIFISIMSAEDYVDCLTRLNKLALKKSQEREIPRILLHCASVEQSWNPYYGLLAHKLCESHSYRKTFQFMLWDALREFEANDDNSDKEDFLGFDNDNDEESELKRIYNLGRFFGFLLAEGSLALHVLRNVNFLVASDNTKLFLEVTLVTFADIIAKKSQVSLVGTGSAKVKSGDLKFNDQLLIERILKAKDETTMLRGLQYFFRERIKQSNFVDGKRQTKRIEWCSDSLFDLIEELLSHSGN